ncbi:MAG TPA: 50S ribosomal protein L13 [Bacteroidetes bacterium]|nr:50S ribosomal protein L13 [Bacteroidota bacterium]
MNTLSYKTISANAQTVQKNWYVVNAEDKTLGRLSSELAKIIRGKNKPDFTPHVDCGDCVIVINAEKVRLTGNKMNAKEYQTYSGYPGGRKVTIAKDQLKRKPTSLVEIAVKGMLPKNRLGRAIFGNLFVYEGSEHPHAAQQPKEINL